MEHTNYCRQMVKQFTTAMSGPSFPEKNREILSRAVDLASKSQKFLLPDGGRLYDDKEYKALDENEPICLPFPVIAIEFHRSEKFLADHRFIRENAVQTNKGLLFAEQRDDAIIINVVAWHPIKRLWVPLPEVALDRTEYLNRNMRQNGYVGIEIHSNNIVPASDYADEIGALLCLLNILQCKNVHVEKSEVGKVRKAMTSGKKGALPFDSYHILTIDVPSKAGEGAATGGHRSPREHLRRGHIRRLADGRRIWINATMVAAGRCAGVVTKDYLVRGAALTNNKA